MVVGGVIGSGIFMKPALMAAQLGSPVWLLLVWVVAGIITLFGALSNAEVAAMMPETGGQYIFFQKMYGDFIAFLYGWSAFVVFNTAGNASIAYVLGTYTEYLLPLPRLSTAVEQSWTLRLPCLGTLYPLENIGVKGITALVVLLLTWINYRSTRSGGNIQVIFTILKVMAFAGVVSILMAGNQGSLHNLYTAAATHPTGWALAGGLVAALSGAFWGYDGWNNITFISGEIHHPQRNIPRSLAYGLIICTVVYAIINMAYLYVLPVERMAQSEMVASEAASQVLGPLGGGIIAVLVIISTFGTTNGNILATARVTFAMAREKQFFSWAGRVHPEHQTPGNALWLQGIWTVLLIFSGSFDMLTDMLIFVSWMFYGLSAIGVFILRRRMPGAPRPYRVWGYPWVPGIFVLFTLFFLVMTLYHDVSLYITGQSRLIHSLTGLALTLTGVPFYWYFKKRQLTPPER